MTNRVLKLLVGCLAALLVVTASGCASIPHKGEVGTQAVSKEDQDVQSRTDPDGPAPGASPSSIVRGFLAAGTSPANSFSVAQSFLTDDFASEWNPLKSVSIIESGLSFESLTASVTTNSRNVSFTVPLQAVLDPSHIYRESPSGSEISVEFKLRQVNGEWRISDAPSGIVLTEANFNSLFQAYPLYFFTPDHKHLVPDVRWFVRGGGTLTEVMRQLLGGPADYLRSAVISVVPEGTTLEPAVVTSDSGTAIVGLSAEADALNRASHDRMYAQISQTLRTNSSITDVSIQTPSATVTSGANVDVQYPINTGAVAVSEGRISQSKNGEQRAVEGSPKVSDKVLPAVNYDGSAFYYTSEDRKTVQVFGKSKKTETLITGQGLVRASIDRFGWVYTAEAKSDRIRAVGENGELVVMTMPFVKDRTIRRIAVSREGSRLAVMSSGSDGTRIDVIGLVRSKGAAPDHLTSATPLTTGLRLENPKDFSWAGSVRFAVLTADETTTEPVSLWAGGPATSLGSISSGANITAANDLHSIRIGTSNGDIYTYTSGTWQRIVGAKAVNPAYSG